MIGQTQSKEERSKSQIKKRCIFLVFKSQTEIENGKAKQSIQTIYFGDYGLGPEMFRNTVRKSCDERKPTGYSCFDHHQVEYPAGQGTEQSAQQVNPECRGFQGKKRKKVS